MNEKENSNTFRFALMQGDVLLCEKIFDADKYNPFTRYTINIRDVLRLAISKLRKTLSKRYYENVISFGDTTYNLLDSMDAHTKMFGKYDPDIVTQQVEDKVIRGVECKIGFYINENPIVEREFYVDGFNPEARWSVDVVDAVEEIGDMIFKQIKSSDIKNMWDDYDLINIKGFTIAQIRELTPRKREEILTTIKRY